MALDGRAKAVSGDSAREIEDRVSETPPRERKNRPEIAFSDRIRRLGATTAETVTANPLTLDKR